MEVDFITSKLLDKEKFSIVSNDFPIGSIVAYAGDLTNLFNLKKLYMAGWLLCDGKSYDKNEKAALYEVIGNSNGGSDGRFNVPDLRNCFLKGKAAKVDEMKAESEFPVRGFVSERSFLYGKSRDRLTSIIDFVCASQAKGKNKISGDEDIFSNILSGSESDKAPVNIALNYIIKANNRQSSGTTPSGAIIAFSGATAHGIPGWLKCDGSFYYNMAYSELHSTISSNYGNAGRNFFNVPDLRESFIKGKSHYTPFDALIRHDTTGEKQGYYTVSSNFDNSVLLPPGPIAPAPGGFFNNAEDCSKLINSKKCSYNTTCLDFLIAKNKMPQSAPPVGTVMCFGGDYSNPMIRKVLSEEGWLPCDGSYLLIEKYEELYNIIGSIYGGGNLTFNLPDLRDLYIVGAGYLPVGEKLYASQERSSGRLEFEREYDSEGSDNISIPASSGVDYIIRVR